MCFAFKKCFPYHDELYEKASVEIRGLFCCVDMEKIKIYIIKAGSAFTYNILGVSSTVIISISCMRLKKPLPQQG
jgi:hypothetical protein